MTGTSNYPEMSSVEQIFGHWLTDEELQIVKQVQEFVEDELIERRSEFEGGWHRDPQRAYSSLRDAYSGLVDLGVQELNVPEERGGLGLSPRVRNAINEVISRADPGLAMLVGKPHGIVGILSFANHEELLDELVPQLTSGVPKTAAFLATEPQGGANVEDLTQEGRSIRLRAHRTEGGYVLDGQKLWGGPGGPAEFFRDDYVGEHLGYVVFATVEPSKGFEGMGVFYVPPDAEGLSFGEPYEKMGMAYTDRNVEYWFNEVEVPRRYRIDDPEQPMQAARIFRGAFITGAKLTEAARLVGSMSEALNIAMDWARDRTIKGQSMRKRPLFAHQFGELARDVEVARSYYMTVTEMLSSPNIHGNLWDRSMVGRAGAARSLCADTAMNVFDQSIQLMGAYGYSYDADVEKLFRDCKILQIAPGGPHRDRLDMAYAYFDHTWLAPSEFKWDYQREAS